MTLTRSSPPFKLRHGRKWGRSRHRGRQGNHRNAKVERREEAGLAELYAEVLDATFGAECIGFEAGAVVAAFLAAVVASAKSSGSVEFPCPDADSTCGQDGCPERNSGPPQRTIRTWNWPWGDIAIKPPHERSRIIGAIASQLIPDAGVQWLVGISYPDASAIHTNRADGECGQRADGVVPRVRCQRSAEQHCCAECGPFDNLTNSGAERHAEMLDAAFGAESIEPSRRDGWDVATSRARLL